MIRSRRYFTRLKIRVWPVASRIYTTRTVSDKRVGRRVFPSTKRSFDRTHHTRQQRVNEPYVCVCVFFGRYRFVINPIGLTQMNAGRIGHSYLHVIRLPSDSDDRGTKCGQQTVCTSTSFPNDARSYAAKDCCPFFFCSSPPCTTTNERTTF